MYLLDWAHVSQNQILWVVASKIIFQSFFWIYFIFTHHSCRSKQTFLLFLQNLEHHQWYPQHIRSSFPQHDSSDERIIKTILWRCRVVLIPGWGRGCSWCIPEIFYPFLIQNNHQRLPRRIHWPCLMEHPSQHSLKSVLLGQFIWSVIFWTLTSSHSCFFDCHWNIFWVNEFLLKAIKNESCFHFLTKDDTSVFFWFTWN